MRGPQPTPVVVRGVDGAGRAEKSLAGVWDHTARGEGKCSGGTRIPEVFRPLQTRGLDDARFYGGMTARMALANWDADETADGCTAKGHLQSSAGG